MSFANEFCNFLSVEKKEKCLKEVLKEFHGELNSMEVQDMLLRHDWNIKKVIEYFRRRQALESDKEENDENDTSTKVNGHFTNGSTPTNHHKSHHINDSGTDDTPVRPIKSSKRRIISDTPENDKNGYTNGNSNDSSDNSSRYPQKKRKVRKDSRSSSDDDGKPCQPVFNSDDDSDYDYSDDIMSRDQKQVYEFFNTASINELTAVKSCSLRKAEVIIENRPFRNWHDLRLKFQTTKPLAPELLNNAQEYVNRRNSLKIILKKCKNIVSRLEAAVEEGANITKQPSLLNPDFNLSEYQMVGLNWLAVIHQNEMNGILADEMGLGKTIQIIAFLAYLKETGQAKNTHLIIVPSSTLDNWANELEKWCPSLRVIKYYGSQEERKMLRIQYAKNFLGKFDVMLTTYHVVGATAEEKKMFRVTPMHYVIFDEAHMLKNMQTARYATLLRTNAERRILLTGTPLQNNLLELMSLLCFVMPSLFHGKIEDIKTLFTKRMPKLDDNPEQATPFEQNQIDRAKNIMKPFILRRLKKDVLTFLPQKSEHLVKVKLTDTQKKKYQQLIEEYKDVKAMALDPLTDVSGSTIMMDMRKLANHPLLLRYYFTDEKLVEISKVLARDSVYKNNNYKQIFEDIAPLSDFKVHQLALKYPSITSMVRIPDNLVCQSGKFKYFDEMLPKLKKDGHRVLIFSQFVMMLDVIEKYLAIRGHQFVRLDGSTAVTDRQDLIEEYTQNSDIFIFLLSTKAGGLGINLTAADTAIIHDIDFNPYNDKQAEDRCHRIGQTKEVTIYKLISEGTIEEGMSLIASEKLKLEREVTSEMDPKEEHKCMVKLLTMSLGLDTNVAEVLLSPQREQHKSDDDEF